MTYPWQHCWAESASADRIWSTVAGLRPEDAINRKIMALQAFIDDSEDNEHGVYVLAGYISTPEKWASFAREWEYALPLSVRQESGSFRFKMSEMAMYNRMENVPAFHTVINNYAEHSIAFVIDKLDLSNIMNRIEVSVYDKMYGELPINVDHLKSYWGDPFVTTFFMFMDNFSKSLVNQPDLSKITDPIDFYFDDTSKKEAIRSVWDQFATTLSDKHRYFFPSEPRFENDENFLPLQAADFRAWWVRRWACEHGVLGINQGRFPFKSAAKPINNLMFKVTREQLYNFVETQFYGNLIQHGVFTQSPLGERNHIHFDLSGALPVIRLR